MSSSYDGEDNRNNNNDDDDGKERESTEMIFKNVEIPKWNNQITLRALVASAILSCVLIFIVMSCSLSTGVVPSFNAAAGLMGFAMLKFYTVILDKFGLLNQPFTRQENTVIQTCVISAGGVAFTGGLTSYLLSMSSLIASGTDSGSLPINIKNIHVGWVMGFMASVSFIGLFSIVPLRKMMIVNYKLLYPSGTATAFLINSFHTPTGGKLAMKQVIALFKSSISSFGFAFFKWLYTAKEDCGFKFPVFGLTAKARRFYFDFSTVYIGVGMICPYMVSVSLMIGAIISYGIMWPWIATKEGDWYPDGLGQTSLHGIHGYRVFLAVGLVMGDGIFQFMSMTIVTLRGLIADKIGSNKHEASGLIEDEYDSDGSNGKVSSHDEKKRLQYFLKDTIPNSWALVGYCVLAIMGVIFVPIIFDYRIRWYHIICGYLIAPVMAFSNAYAVGVTDVSMAANYGKVAVLVFSSWVGLEHGGIIAGLAGCGVMMNIVFVAGELMNDFKTGYLTLTSPRSMFLSQIFGTAIGCLLSPLVYNLISKAYNIGDPEGRFPAPMTMVFRGIALLGVEGVSALPKNCLNLSIAFLISAFVLNLVTQLLAKHERRFRIHRFIPSPVCMAIPFFLGGTIAIDMCIGSLIMLLWKRKDKKSAADFSMVVASGFMCGDSLFTIPESILSLMKVNPPMCMAFFSASQTAAMGDLIS